MIVRESATPLYEQVKAWLVGEIRAGALAEHAQVPSERRLVRDLGVSRITVRRALSDLARAGVIYAVPARGFYVSCFPHRVRGGSAGWTRAVAILDDALLALSRR